MTPISIPQGRIPFGWVSIPGQAQRLPVEIDPEWMRVFTVLLARSGGVAGNEDMGGNVFAGSSLDGQSQETMGDIVQSDTQTFSFVPDIVQPLASTSVLPDPLVVQAGTNAAPAITTVGDLNTGIYFPAADSIGITAAAVKQVGIDIFGVGLQSGSKFNLDGPDSTGDTYLIQAVANVLDIYAGGTKALTIESTGITPVGGVDATITTASLVGKTITVVKGIITDFS